MEIKELHYRYTTSTSQCVREVISPLSFYSQEARTQEIAKFSSDNLWKFVGDKNHCNIVAIENGEVVGFLFGSVDANVLFVTWLGMKENYRHSGHMQTLWNKMEDWCRERNIRRVWLDTNQLNKPAIEFMHKVGLKICGALVNFWYGHDYLLWEKTINGKSDGEL